ncbi:MAG: hypothetical protein LUF92_04880 [Clostridiales bacterium]|nr:hypothetical protein [Clostridiales bacterium]
MFVFKIALVSIGGALLVVVVQQFQKEYSAFVLFAVCLFLIGCLTANVSIVIDFARDLGDKIQISGTYIKLLFKLLGIAYICQIASGICQDL